MGIENSEVYQTSVYPNPGDGYFIVQLHTESTEKIQVKVWSMDGKTVYVTQLVATGGQMNYQLDLHSLSSGTYVMEMTGEAGKVYHRLVIR